MMNFCALGNYASRKCSESNNTGVKTTGGGADVASPGFGRAIEPVGRASAEWQTATILSV